MGTSIIYRSRLTVPGGISLRAAWLTMITVASSHQGRGIWLQLSAQGLGILLERGYPIICGVSTRPGYTTALAPAPRRTATLTRSIVALRSCEPHRAPIGRARSTPPRQDAFCRQSMSGGAPTPRGRGAR